MIDILTACLVLAGALLILIAAIGLVRLPDVLCRSHAIAKAMTLGIFLLLFGLWFHLEGEEASLKILLAIFFQVVTIPIASHLVGLLALKKNLPLWRGQARRPAAAHRRPT
jgi:multicomponent Na+:H+ antiporter subunit G